jgi:hypothetical protein
MRFSIPVLESLVPDSSTAAGWTSHFTVLLEIWSGTNFMSPAPSAPGFICLTVISTPGAHHCCSGIPHRIEVSRSRFFLCVARVMLCRPDFVSLVFAFPFLPLQFAHTTANKCSSSLQSALASDSHWDFGRCSARVCFPTRVASVPGSQFPLSFLAVGFGFCLKDLPSFLGFDSPNWVSFLIGRSRSCS